MAQDRDRVIAASDAESRAREAVAAALADYASKRVASYQGLTLDRLLQKDALMVALRGVTTAEQYVDAMLAAFESSSEETHMGETWQRIALDLAGRAVDLSDMVLQRNGDLWVVEVKSQPNTVTGTFRNDLLRKLKARVGTYARTRRVKGGQIRAMLGVIRGPARDEGLTCRFAADSPYYDLNGFSYRYLVGRPFWVWLTGRPSIQSLVGEITPLAAPVAQARSDCRRRLQDDMRQRLRDAGAATDMSGVLQLIDLSGR